MSTTTDLEQRLTEALDTVNAARPSFAVQLLNSLSPFAILAGVFWGGSAASTLNASITTANVRLDGFDQSVLRLEQAIEGLTNGSWTTNRHSGWVIRSDDHFRVWAVELEREINTAIAEGRPVSITPPTFPTPIE